MAVATKAFKDRLSLALTRDEQEGELPRIEKSLAELVPQLQLVVPAGMDVTQFTRDAIQLARKTPKLVLCQPDSVMGAFMTAAQLGLRPGVSALGQAHILPFWNKKIQTPIMRDGKFTGKYSTGGLEAVFVIGYPGMIELANRSNRLKSVAARAVYSNEEFFVDYGANQPFTHRPALDGEKGELRGFYADIRTINEGQYFEYWSKADMEAHRDRFALAKTKEGKVFGPWADHFIQMARKTMIRQAFNYMPRATDLSIALAADSTVRHDWRVEEGTTMEDLGEKVTPVNPEDAGTLPSDYFDDGFTLDTSPGAPPEDEQREIYRQEKNDD